MPRIAVVTPYFPTSANPHGGRSAYETLKQLRGYADIHVVAPIATYPEFEFLKPRSYQYRKPAFDYEPPLIRTDYVEYPVFPVVSRPANGFICASRIRPILEKIRPNLILNYWLYPEGYATVSMARRLGVPSVVCAIGSDIRRIPEPVTRWFTMRTLRNSTAVISVSRELRERIIQMGIPGQKVHAVLNGCDSDIFHPADQASARAALGLDSECELIVYAGSLIPTKGLRELKQAFLELRPRHRRLQLAMLGAGALRPELEGPGILLPGSCDTGTVARWMNAADVFTLPSYSEGCPNVVIEALACGRAVVASNVGGIPELLSGECGIMVPPADADKLAEALHEALVQPWDRDLIAQSSRRGWDEVARETWEVCRPLLEKGRA